MQHTVSRGPGRGYAIRVHVPDGDIPERGHPLVWLLDAPTTWAPMQHALNGEPSHLAVVAGIDWDHDGGVDPALRQRDFTHTSRTPVDGPDGEADAFLAFLTGALRTRLLPELPVDPDRQTLAGHSLSGLFVLDALLRQPQAFARHVALSPSLWWDDSALLDGIRGADATGLRDARLLVRVGGAEQTAGPEKPADIDGEAAAAMLGDRHMIANAQRFCALAQHRGLACDFDVIADTGHHTMLEPAMSAALRFACAQ